MINNSQLISPVLMIVSVGLVAYLVYLISLMLLGSTFRMADNLILILVIVAAVIILAFIIREQTKIQEKLNRILAGAREGEEMATESPEEEKKEPKKKEKPTKKARPAPVRKGKLDDKKLGEISILTKKMFELAGTDVEKAKDAYMSIRNLYDSLSEEEKKLMIKENIKVTNLYKKISKKPS